MAQINILFIYCLVTFSILHSTNASGVAFQIDEFIKQLMSSEKFDELTDVIARKAAQRIKNMDKATDVPSPVLRKPEGVDDNKSKDMKFELKPHQNTQLRSNNIQFKHVKIKTIDSKSDENRFGSDPTKIKGFKSGAKANKDRNDEIHENGSEKNKESIETNSDRHADKNSQTKSKNNREENKNSKIERNISGPERNVNSPSREEKLISAEQSQSRWQAKHYQKSLRSSEIEPNDSKIKTKFENASRIDTHALLNSHINSKELELNFKHLKKKIQKHGGKETIVKSDKTYNNRKNSHENNYKSKIKHDDNEYTRNERKDVSFSQNAKSGRSNSENEKHEQSEYHEPRHKKNKLRPNESHDENSESEDLRNNKRAEDYKSSEKPIARIGKSGNDSEEINKTDEELSNAKSFIDRVMDRVSKELKNPTYAPKEGLEDITEKKNHSFVSKEVVVVGLESKHADESEINHSDSLDKPDNTRNTPSHRKIFREEDGKQFTYLSSAEYAEYHENLANAPKPKYFNTY